MEIIFSYQYFPDFIKNGTHKKTKEFRSFKIRKHIHKMRIDLKSKNDGLMITKIVNIGSDHIKIFIHKLRIIS